MASDLFYIDGYHSREYHGEASHYGNSGEVRWGNNGGNRVHVYPAEGRFFGQAGAGRYGNWFGQYHYIVTPTKASYKWWQHGGWYRWNTDSSYFGPSSGNDAWFMRTAYYIKGGSVTNTAHTWTGSYFRWTTPDGELTLNGPATYTSGVNGTKPANINEWYWFECRWGFETTATGVAEMRINNSQIHRFTNVQTLGTGSPAMPNVFVYDAWDYYNSTADVRLDDQYVMVADTEGELSWLGPSVAEPCVPNGDGDLNAWTASGASRYGDVNELPKNDADYVYATSGANKQQLFTMTNLDTSRTRTIHGVKAVARARKTGGADRTLRPICKVNGVVYNGDTLYVAPDWKEIYHIWKNNPNTGSAWTASEVNGAQFGFEQVA